MKNNRQNLLLAAALIFTFAAPSAQAAALTWSGGNGNWQTGIAGGWSAAWNNATPDTGTFNGAGGTVTVLGAITHGNTAALAFTSGNYNLQSDGATERVITLGSFASTATLGNGVATTVGNKVTLSRSTGSVLVDGDSTATSTLNIDAGGKLATTGANNAISISEATCNVNSSGTIDTDSSLAVGNTADGANLKVLGGSVTVGKANGNANIILGNTATTSPTVSLKITGGSIGFATTGNALNVHSIRVGPLTPGGGVVTGTIDVEGGITTVNSFFETSDTYSSTLNLHGGTIKALATNPDFIKVDNVWIKSGGAIFDTNGKAITVTKDMLTDVSSTGGGLTLNDTAVTKGSLTLSGANITYTGPTLVTAGKLVVPSTHAGTGAATVSANATLSVNVSGTSQWLPASLTLANPCTLEFSSVQNPGTTTAPILPTASVGSVSGVTVHLKSIVGTPVVGSSYPLIGKVSSAVGYTLGTQPLGITGILAVSGNTLVYTVQTVSDIWTGADGTNPTFWDIGTTVNWVGKALANLPAGSYADGDAVLFDDTATPISPVAVELQTAVVPGNLAFNNSAKAYTVSASGAFGIGGSGSLTKNGSGALTLSSSNSYNGGTTLNGGILTHADNNALGTNGVAINPGATRLVVNDGVTLANNITINGGGALGRGLIENSSSGNATLSGGTITINAGTSAGGHFGSTGGGTLTVDDVVNSASTPISWRIGTGIFSGGGSYANFAIGQGTVRLGADNGLSTSATLDIAPAGAGNFDLAGFNQILVGITKNTNAATIGNSVSSSTSTLTTTGTSSYAGILADNFGSGTGKVALKVNGGALTLTNTNTYSGDTTVSAGTLSIGIANPSNESSTVTIDPSAFLDLTYAGTDTVGALFIGTTQMAPGVYGNNTSILPVIATNRITGPGTLTVAAGYSAWQTANGTLQTIDQDHDSDGVSNGVEFFLGGTNNTTGLTAVPGVINTAGVLSVTWVRNPGYPGFPGNYGTDFAVETSTTLAAGSWTTEASGINVIISGNNVTYTFPAGTIRFARLKVTGP